MGAERARQAALLFRGKMLFLKGSRGVGGQGKSGRDDGLPMNR